jgi:TonB family protein
VQRRAAQVPAGSGASKDLDKQIAAAVERRAQQAGPGSGGGAPGPGGPISVGPGSGAGGTAADLQYILYQGRMEERIKAAWAWAGADKTLHAVIQFNLTPEGEIKNVRTLESSGDRQYDTSCERAVRAVSPLEPVPEKYREVFATVEMTFKPSDLEH